MDEQDQAAVIAFLSAPSTYGDAAVERIDTHASVVFLAGDHAYKLKRAVRFSYLDYSTRALREQFCRGELALNRRTAPDMYQEVRSITLERDGGLAFNGLGPAVDWVVVMRRFDQETLFDRLAEHGELTGALMINLAEQIAQFHAVADVDFDAGGFAGMIETVEGNASNLWAAVPLAFDYTDVTQLVATTGSAVSRLADCLEARRRTGKVRRCHGDLHLRNICLVDDRPTLFDCVEFNRAIACIDVLYDLAFLLMDLHARRLDSHASTVFNRYLDLQSETDGLAALPLFLSVRAAVRAHVTVAEAHKQSSHQHRHELIDLARRYLALAMDLLRSQPPRLIAIGGLSGTGKSTLAYGLAPELGGAPGARVLRSDVIRKRLLGVGLPDRLPPTAYAADTSKRVYLTIIEETMAALAAGQSVVADAVYGCPEERAAIAEVGRKCHVPFVGVWLEAPTEVLESRIESRRGDASDADVAVLRRQLTYDVGQIDWQRVSAGGSIEAMLASTRQILSRATED